MSYSDAEKPQNGKSIIEKVIEIQSAHITLIPADDEILMVFSNSNLDVAKALYSDMSGYIEKARGRVPIGTKTPQGKSLISTMNACSWKGKISETCLAARAQYQALMGVNESAGPKQLASRGRLLDAKDRMVQSGYRAKSGAPINFLMADAKNERKSNMLKHQDSAAYKIGAESLEHIVSELEKDELNYQATAQMGGDKNDKYLNSGAKDKITKNNAKGGAIHDARTLAMKSVSSEDWFKSVNEVLDYYGENGMDRRTKRLLENFMVEANRHVKGYDDKVDEILSNDAYLQYYCDGLKDVRDASATHLFVNAFRDGTADAETRIQGALKGIPPGSKAAARAAIDKLGREIHGDEGFDENLKSAVKSYMDVRGKRLAEKYGNKLTPQEMLLVKRDVITNMPSYKGWVTAFEDVNAKNLKMGPVATLNIDDPKSLPKSTQFELGKDVVKNLYHSMGEDGLVVAAQFMQGTLTDAMIKAGKDAYDTDVAKGVNFTIGNRDVIKKQATTWADMDANPGVFESMSYAEQVNVRSAMEAELTQAAMDNGVTNGKAIKTAVDSMLDSYRAVPEKSRASYAAYRENMSNMNVVGGVTISNHALVGKTAEAYTNDPELVKRNMRTNGQLNAFGRFFEDMKHLADTNYQHPIIGKGMGKVQKSPDEVHSDIKDVVNSVDSKDRAKIFSPEMLSLAENPPGAARDWVAKSFDTNPTPYVRAGMDLTTQEGVDNFKNARDLLGKLSIKGRPIPQEAADVPKMMYDLENDIKSDLGISNDNVDMIMGVIKQTKGDDYANKILRSRLNRGLINGNDRMASAGIIGVTDSEDVLYDKAKGYIRGREGNLDSKGPKRPSDYNTWDLVQGAKGIVTSVGDLRDKRAEFNNDKTKMFDYSMNQISLHMSDYAYKTQQPTVTMGELEKDGDASVSRAIGVHIKSLRDIASGDQAMNDQINKLLGGSYNQAPPATAAQPQAGGNAPPQQQGGANAVNTPTPPAPPLTMRAKGRGESWRTISDDQSIQDENFKDGVGNLQAIMDNKSSMKNKNLREGSDVYYLNAAILDRINKIEASTDPIKQRYMLGEINAMKNKVAELNAPKTTQNNPPPPPTAGGAAVLPPTQPPTQPVAAQTVAAQQPTLKPEGDEGAVVTPADAPQALQAPAPAPAHIVEEIPPTVVGKKPIRTREQIALSMSNSGPNEWTNESISARKILNDPNASPEDKETAQNTISAYEDKFKNETWLDARKRLEPYTEDMKNRAYTYKNATDPLVFKDEFDKQRADFDTVMGGLISNKPKTKDEMTARNQKIGELRNALVEAVQGRDITKEDIVKFDVLDSSLIRNMSGWEPEPDVLAETPEQSAQKLKAAKDAQDVIDRTKQREVEEKAKIAKPFTKTKKQKWSDIIQANKANLDASPAFNEGMQLFGKRAESFKTLETIGNEINDLANKIGSKGINPDEQIKLMGQYNAAIGRRDTLQATLNTGAVAKLITAKKGNWLKSIDASLPIIEGTAPFKSGVNDFNENGEEFKDIESIDKYMTNIIDTELQVKNAAQQHHSIGKLQAARALRAKMQEATKDKTNGTQTTLATRGEVVPDKGSGVRGNNGSDSANVERGSDIPEYVNDNAKKQLQYEKARAEREARILAQPSYTGDYSSESPTRPSMISKAPEENWLDVARKVIGDTSNLSKDDSANIKLGVDSMNNWEKQTTSAKSPIGLVQNIVDKASKDLDAADSIEEQMRLVGRLTRAQEILDGLKEKPLTDKANGASTSIVAGNANNPIKTNTVGIPPAGGTIPLTDEQLKAAHQQKMTEIGITYGSDTFKNYVAPKEVPYVEVKGKDKPKEVVAKELADSFLVYRDIQNNLKNNQKITASVEGKELPIVGIKISDGRPFVKLGGDNKDSRSLNTLTHINGIRVSKILSGLKESEQKAIQQKAIDTFTPEFTDKIIAQKQAIYDEGKEDKFGQKLEMKDIRGKSTGISLDPVDEANKAHWDAALLSGRLTGDVDNDAILTQNIARKIGERDGWLARMKSGGQPSEVAEVAEVADATNKFNPEETYKDILSKPMSESSLETANNKELISGLKKITNIKNLDGWFNETVAPILNDNTGVNTKADKEIAVGELHAYLKRRGEIASVPPKQGGKTGGKTKEPTLTGKNSVRSEQKKKAGELDEATLRAYERIENEILNDINGSIRTNNPRQLKEALNVYRKQELNAKKEATDSVTVADHEAAIKRLNTMIKQLDDGVMPNDMIIATPFKGRMTPKDKETYDKAYEEQMQSLMHPNSAYSIDTLKTMINELETSIGLGDENTTLAEDKGHLKATQVKLNNMLADEALKAKNNQKEEERKNANILAERMAQREINTKERPAAPPVDKILESEIDGILESDELLGDKDFELGESKYAVQFSEGVKSHELIKKVKDEYPYALDKYAKATTDEEKRQALIEVSVLSRLKSGVKLDKIINS